MQFLKEYWENFEFQTWVIDNSLWFILVSVFIIGGWKIVWDILNAFRISRILLRQNRDTLGNAWGKHSADRFVGMWYSSDKNPLREFGSSMYKFPNTINSRHNVDAVDKELHALGLVNKDTGTYDSVYKPVKNRRNKMALALIEFWLVNISGDNSNYYKELKSRLEKI